MRGGLSLRPTYYEALRRLTLQLAGVQMGSDHAFLVETRLSQLARKEGYETLDAMIEDLFAVGQARLAVHVVSALVERDTHFNRDPASLDALFDTALPDLVEKRGGGRIDLLSYGCGSGQDLYSIAIRARHAAARAMLAPVDLHLKGVDYPSQALERARTGRYTHFEIQRGLSARDMIAHFTPDPVADSTDWLAAAHLRETVKFQDMHLLSGTQEAEAFHVVLFRGAIGQYGHAARIRVIRTLAKLLRPHGYLVTGSDEDLGEIHPGLEKVESAPGLYRRRVVQQEPAPVIGKPPPGRTTFEPPVARRAHG
ncbi:CheR family methyltransferase [uncultured Algimonas sp.]|uniref:CheR family methyltransferase n=1 Tax=uncultured Algimonas sp. TaxID=1547920 RepID=UPI0026146646|nr:CheR family methyltransferase [uncultured Algimonas sp.]